MRAWRYAAPPQRGVPGTRKNYPELFKDPPVTRGTPAKSGIRRFYISQSPRSINPGHLGTNPHFPVQDRTNSWDEEKQLKRMRTNRQHCGINVSVTLSPQAYGGFLPQASPRFMGANAPMILFEHAQNLMTSAGQRQLVRQHFS